MLKIRLNDGRHGALAILFAAVLTACGGGGSGDGVGSVAPPVTNPPVPVEPVEPAEPLVALRWVSSAAHEDINGDSDAGIAGLGVLRVADPERPAVAATLLPNEVHSRSVRIMGGDLSGAVLSNASPRHVLFDARTAATGEFAFGLHRLTLGAAGSAAPSVQKVSSETAMCPPPNITASRFLVVGQSLSGSEAVITYSAPDVLGSCANGGVPKVVALTMSGSAAPLALPVLAEERVLPIAPLHAATGAINQFLVWQNGRFRLASNALVGLTDVTLAAGDVMTNAAPLVAGDGLVTRTGIFVRSTDGLRRYDKASRGMSGVLVAGEVGKGLRVNAVHDDRDLYITQRSANGAIDLYRVSDQPLASAVKLNTEGPITGFSVLKGHVLYAVAGRDSHVAWRKSDGQRTSVLAGKRIQLASTLHDRVFHSTPAAGGTVLASSAIDGTAERVLGVSQLVAGSIASEVDAYARTVRGNGAFSHALVASRAAGSSGLAGGTLRWVSFDSAAQDIEGGTFPATPSLAATVDGPAVIGNAVLFGVAPAAPAAAAAPLLFVARRAANTLSPVTP